MNSNLKGSSSVGWMRFLTRASFLAARGCTWDKSSAWAPLCSKSGHVKRCKTRRSARARPSAGRGSFRKNGPVKLWDKRKITSVAARSAVKLIRRKHVETFDHSPRFFWRAFDAHHSPCGHLGGNLIIGAKAKERPTRRV